MVNSYDEIMGTPMDPIDHEADGGHNDGFNKGRVGRSQMAGDVIEIPMTSLQKAIATTGQASNDISRILKDPVSGKNVVPFKKPK